MKRIKSPFIPGIAIALLLLLVGPGFNTSQAAQTPTGSSQVRVVSIQGITKVDGEDTIVEILVAVKPEEDALEAARAALRRAYPDAREINSANYKTTGLVWDVFLDNDPGNDMVDVRYNPKGVPGNYPALDYINALVAAQSTWTNVSSSKFVFNDAGETGKCPSLVRECKGRQTFDGNNDVGWLDIHEPGVLGVTWYGTSTDEFDMVLDNADYTWYLGDPAVIPSNAIDVETVWLHEFGHGAGLAHSDVSGAVMEPYYDGLRRVLHQDDIDGISFLYPASSGPTPTPTPTPAPVPGDTFSVTAINYTWYGGKNNDKHLDDMLTLEDDKNNPVAGATVSITLNNTTTKDTWNGTGTTSSDGTVVFSLKNAPAGCYTTTIIDVTAEGLTWDSVNPDEDTCL
jgi:hypothetical protein